MQTYKRIPCKCKQFNLYILIRIGQGEMKTMKLLQHTMNCELKKSPQNASIPRILNHMKFNSSNFRMHPFPFDGIIKRKNTHRNTECTPNYILSSNAVWCFSHIYSIQFTRVRSNKKSHLPHTRHWNIVEHEMRMHCLIAYWLGMMLKRFANGVECLVDYRYVAPAREENCRAACLFWFQSTIVGKYSHR